MRPRKFSSFFFLFHTFTQLVHLLSTSSYVTSLFDTQSLLLFSSSAAIISTFQLIFLENCFVWYGSDYVTTVIPLRSSSFPCQPHKRDSVGQNIFFGLTTFKRIRVGNKHTASFQPLPQRFVLVFFHCSNCRCWFSYSAILQFLLVEILVLVAWINSFRVGTSFAQTFCTFFHTEFFTHSFIHFHLSYNSFRHSATGFITI